MKMKFDPDLAMEAKALVVLAFRNGPIEDLHAGRPCSVCRGSPETSHISDGEMTVVMKSAVDAMYRPLWQRDYDPSPTTKRWRSDAATPFTGMILNSRSRGGGHARSDLTPERPMFKELAPYLRQRAVLLTVTRLEDDQISVNIIPKKLQDSENTALTTPFKLTGTAEELDRDLPSSIVDFVASHLQLKSTLERAKAEMDVAGKAAQAEARAKKLPAKKDPPKTEPVKPVATVKPVEVAKPEPPKTFSLFDTPVSETPVAEEVDEEEEILAEAAEDEQADQEEELDEAA